MEIKEIVSYFLNHETNILEVSFKTISDNYDLLRNDIIDYNVVLDYGFNLVPNQFDFFSDSVNEDVFEIENTDLDESELITFLNEYYMVNPKLLPKPEFY